MLHQNSHNSRTNICRTSYRFHAFSNSNTKSEFRQSVPREKNFGDIICDSLIDRDGNYTSNEAEIQKVISEIETWRSVIQTAIPTVLVMFMGAWSDRTGNRKICILLPVIGEFSVCVSNILSTYFFYEIPVEVTMLLETLLPAITGGWVMMYLGVFSYISDITTTESRTFRVGMANLCMTAGIPIGTALSGILLKVGGYYGVFSISGIIYFITFLYGLINLKSCTKPGHDANEKVIIKTRLTHNFTSIQRDLALIVIIIVNYYNNYYCKFQNETLTVKELVTMQRKTVEVVTRKRESNYRIKIILTLLVVALAYGPNHGNNNFHVWSIYFLPTSPAASSLHPVGVL